MENTSLVGGMIVSGLISTAIALLVIFVLGQLMPFPWDMSRTLLCVAIASFSGSAVSFVRGFGQGRGGN
jgi:hypothetical protein